MATYLEFIAPYFERASFPLSEALKSKAKVLNSFQSHCVMNNYYLENLDIQKWAFKSAFNSYFSILKCPCVNFFFTTTKATYGHS